MIFDSTYITTTLCQMQLHGHRGLVGGTWGAQSTSNAWVDLESEDLDVGTVQKSSTMLECILLDPSARHKAPLSVASIPVEHNWTSANAGMRGNLYILELLGMILKKEGGCVKALVCDSHGTHQHLKHIMFGNLSVMPEEDLKKIPWFGELTAEPLPSTNLPHLPIKIMKHSGEVVWHIPGACAWESVKIC